MKAIYAFEDADSKNRALLGGKGAGLSEMTKLKLPVPPGFTITTEVCNEYYENKNQLPKNLMSQVIKNISKIEKKTGKKWNSSNNPLLVSVRSGAAISMPGMMDTILNLGLNDQTVLGLAKMTDNPRFAWDSYRRFIQLFGKVVFGVNDEKFDSVLKASKKKQGVTDDSKLNVDSLKKIVVKYKKICENQTKRKFPTNPNEQIQLAIDAVFRSWMGERAVVYREKNNITRDIASGTAVNCQTMVFGNMGNDSATGVVFTRNGQNGIKEIEGEYLLNAQGEDVVAGVRTGKDISKLQKEMPKSYKELFATCKKLEKHFREPQDIEFTTEQGKFYILQTRTAKMSAFALIKTSVDMVKEKLIDKNRALSRIPAQQLEALLHKTIDYSKTKDFKQLAKGIAASPGAASGIAVFDVKKAIAMGENNTKVILIRIETKPEDVPAFFSSEGILTSLGGKSSHAAIVSRGMGKPCIVGCSELKVDYDKRKCNANGITILEGDTITIDGSMGTVYAGVVPTIAPQVTKDFETILTWAQKAKRLGIRANADTPDAAKLARKYGAEGIGLCRTERMFNANDRLSIFVDMKFILLLASIIYLSLSNFYCLAKEAKSDEGILKVGLIVPLSGRHQEIGKSVLNSIRLALSKINNDQIEIFPKDNYSNPEKTLFAARQLESEGVRIVIGPIFHQNLINLGEVQNLTFLSLSNKTITIPRNVITMGINANSQINAIVDFIKKENLNKTIVLVPKSNFEDELRNALVKSKYEFMNIYSYDVKPDKLTSQIKQITAYDERKEKLEKIIEFVEKGMEILEKEEELEDLKKNTFLEKLTWIL